MRSSPSAGCVCFQLVSLTALFLPRTALSPTLMTDGGSCAAVNSPLPPAVPRLLWSKSKNLQYHRVIRRLLKPPVNQAFSSRKKKISSMRDVIERVESSRVESSVFSLYRRKFCPLNPQQHCWTVFLSQTANISSTICTKQTKAGYKFAPALWGLLKRCWKGRNRGGWNRLMGK